MPSLIEFRHVSLRFANKRVLVDFNWQVKRGDKVVIFGKSGVGKSTLLRLLLGFQRPDSGQIFFNGRAVESKNIWQIRRRIAYVDQDVMLGQGKVIEVLGDYFSLQANRHLKFDLDKIISQLAALDLPKQILEQQIEKLSGGERQRLAISLALMLNRELLVFDEVTSALDPASKQKVIRAVLAVKKKTVLIVTHDREWYKRREVKLFDFKEKKWKR